MLFFFKWALLWATPLCPDGTHMGQYSTKVITIFSQGSDKQLFMESAIIQNSVVCVYLSSDFKDKTWKRSSFIDK